MLQTAINICVLLVKQHRKINEYAVAYLVYRYFILDYLINLAFYNIFQSKHYRLLPKY